jgi:hypothetical protein
MDEELIDYFFGIAQKEGFKKTREDFVKYVQTDDELFDYLYGKAQREGYKRSKDHFAGLVGRGANQPVQEPVKTEAVTETVTTEPAKTETVTEESPMAAKEPISMPTKFSAREVSETVEPSKVDLTNKEKADRLKDITEAKKDAMAEDMSSKLMPVTENTKIKEVVEEKKKAEVPTDIKVKEVVKEEPVKEVKIESKSNMPSYDDLGIEKGTNLITNTPYVLPKGIEFEKLPPNELASSFTDKFSMIENVKLNRNTSLRYPDPPGEVFKKQNINGKEVYSSYDKNNDKWYTFIEGSKNNNWNEVTSSPIKTILDSKFLKKSDLFNEKNIKDRSDIVRPTQDEKLLIQATKMSVLQNVYIPYLLKNEDKLSDDNVKKLNKIIQASVHPSILLNHTKEKSFTGTMEEWLKEKERISNISNTNEIITEDITDKNHLKIINDVIARSDAKENVYFKRFFESKDYPVEKFSYNEIKNNKLNSYRSILGDVFYDKNKDEFYWTEDSQKRGDDKSPYFIIKKGTPDYDKIKNSLDKYNK